MPVKMSLTITEHLVLWAIGISFISIYALYDKYRIAKYIGDAFLYIGLWYNKKVHILLFAIPPLALSILSLIYDLGLW